MLTRENFKGIWAGIPVAWNDDETFDEKTYRQDIESCCIAKIPGIYTGGTTGEFYAQEFEDFCKITDATIEECKNAGVSVMIGCTSTYTGGAIRKALYAVEKGADAIQMALPFWLSVPDDCVVSFFYDVSKTVGKIPISIYCAGERMKKNLSVEILNDINRNVPSVFHIKGINVPEDQKEKACLDLSKNFNVFIGEHLLSKLGRCGAVGSCSSLVYLNPSILLHMQKLLFEKNWSELDLWCEKVRRIIFEGLSPLFKKRCEDSAIDRLIGISAYFLKTSLRCKRPYPYCSKDDLYDFRKWLENNFPEFLNLEWKNANKTD
ncbi:MAG: Trans-O-hydroxybenzylidenepyruvate hydratase-aldolase [candidate division TA06 bacterium ADurb.Bin131]|jgi:dihydrodipicolinate synthase/N-acetylneuraminate lyase|uniref:Trans-O-hydroxybenzylidenepyruvate hydratase-aldolase n=1 Tax=candidate division TA06 bacterium ADurb.Bin131 TaxID=1852827 RepID=A0A1V6C3X5_UNCT6|nr:MAG: Trans-O-hydroxybenzylidenepyruvate hydratase-aldolase [candidate division TA06 bacterium ADurb.Bin131]HQL65484.1 dihydrodipicolinate synthase family protein [bacterium]